MRIDFLKFLSIILAQSRNQRIFNGLLSLLLLGVIVYTWRFVHISSDIRSQERANLIKLLFLVYGIQTFVNRRWINTFIICLYLLLIAYVISTFVYSFFDPNDSFLKKEYGLLFRSSIVVARIVFFIVLIWLTNKIRPQLITRAISENNL